MTIPERIPKGNTVRVEKGSATDGEAFHCGHPHMLDMGRASGLPSIAS